MAKAPTTTKKAAKKKAPVKRQPSAPKRSRKKADESTENLPATTPGTALTPAEMAEQFAIDAGQGAENVGAEDMAIPFLVVLQANSPQAIKGGPEYVEGAEAGDLFNNVTGELWGSGEGVNLVPCFFQKAFVEWIPREQGGGFVGQHSDASILKQCARNEKGRDALDGGKGNEIVPTAYHFCLLLRADGTSEPVVVSMSSTQLKKSRRWNSAIAGQKVKTSRGVVTPPAFSHIYHATTNAETNDKGTWYGWNIVPKSMIDDGDLYATAKAFYESIQTGAVRMGPPPEGPTSETVPETEEF